MSKRSEKRALRAMGNAHDPEELVIPRLSGKEYDIRPSGAFVLGAVLQQSEITAGGVVIPEQYREGRMPQWEILAVGPGGIGSKGERIPVNVEVGDHVLLAPQLGAICELPDHVRKTALIHESAIIGVVREKVKLDA